MIHDIRNHPEFRKANAELTKVMFAADKEAQKLDGYSGATFRRMLAEHGGYDTALKLLEPLPAGQVHEGFTTLLLHRRLDLSVEGIVIRLRYKLIFAGPPLEEAKRRILNAGCSISRFLVPGGVSVTIDYEHLDAAE